MASARDRHSFIAAFSQADTINRKVTLIRERRERQAEKQRMEERAAKMSAKRLQRLKKVSFRELVVKLTCSARAVRRRSTDRLTLYNYARHYMDMVYRGGGSRGGWWC